MKEQALTASPFAALDTREKMEQWIWWQCQHPKDVATGTDLEALTLPELKKTERKEEAKEPTQAVPLRTQAMPPIRHGQYDAVIKRMKMAQKQTTAYIPWTDTLSISSASADGSPNAEK